MATIPPSVASAPGSTGKKTPSGRSASSSCLRVTPACTLTSRSSTDRRRIAVHLAHVDADAALQRRDVALERGAGAEGDERRAVARADADDRGGLLGARRVDDGVGRRERVEGLVDAVLLAHVASGEHAIGAELRAQIVEHPRGVSVGQTAVLGHGGHADMGPHRRAQRLVRRAQAIVSVRVSAPWSSR